MRLQVARAQIEGFGGLVQRDFALSGGLTLVFGKNEEGKSTWVAFVKAVLFGLSPADAAPWRPWQPGAAFAGELTLLRGEAQIAIRREFDTNEILWRETDLATGALRDELKGSVSPRARRAIREEYNNRLAALLGFASMEIFSSCVMAQQGRLRDIAASELGPELRVRLTGGEGADYEAALRELNESFEEITNEELRTGSNDRLLQAKRRERQEKEAALAQARLQWARLGECRGRMEKAKQQRDSLSDRAAAGQALAKALDELDKANARLEELEKQYGLLAGQLRQIEETEKKLAAAESELSRFQDEARAPLHVKERLAEAQRLQDALRAAEERAAALQERYRTRTRTLVIEMLAGGVIVCLFVAFGFGRGAGLGAAAVLAVLLGAWLAAILRKQRGQLDAALSDSRQAAARLKEIEQEIGAVWPGFQSAQAAQYLQRLDAYARAKAYRDGIAASTVARDKREEYVQSKDLLERELAEARRQMELIFRQSPSLRKMDAAEQLRLRSQCEEDKRRLAAAQEALRQADLALAACRGPDRSPEELEDEIQSLAGQEARLARRRDALRIARATLAESIEEYRSNYVPQLEQMVNDRFSTITGEKDRQVKLDDALSPTLRWGDGSQRESGVLSAGGLDQLYFSIRLAAMNLLSGGGASGTDLPLILDDPFSAFDDGRFARAMEMLRALSARHQIILLTHDERAKKYADKVVGL